MQQDNMGHITGHLTRTDGKSDRPLVNLALCGR